MKFNLLELRKRYLFAWDSVLLVAVGGVSGLIFFLFHAVMKRMMGAADYSSLVALLGLLKVLGLPVAAMTFTISRFVAEHIHKQEISAWVTIYKRALRRITAYAAVGLAIWILCSVFIADFVSAPSVLAIIILGIIAVVRLYKPIITGVLQGSRSFGYLALTNFTTPFLRLAFSVAVVWLGARVAGVMGAIAASILAGMLIASIPFRQVVGKTETIKDYDTAPIYRYLFPVLLTQGAFLLLMNADIVFFKRFLFGAYKDLAPAYAQAATLSRAVIFIAQPLAIAMFPRAVNSGRKLIFLGPLLFAAAAALAAATLISLFPELPFKLMYGTDDPECFAIARRYVWAALPLSLTAMAMKYLWARHKTGQALILLPVVAVYLLLLFFHHRTPAQIIACLAISSWSALALLLLFAFIPPSRESAKKRMLIISLAGAGDTLMATPLIDELKEAYPQVRIDILTMQGVAARDIVRAHPGIDQRHHYDFMGSNRLKCLQCCLKLRRQRYDISYTIMPQNRLEYNLVTWLIGARERLGFDFKIKCGTLGKLLLTKRIEENTDLHIVENNLRLLSEGLGQPLAKESHDLTLILEDANQAFAEQFINEHGLTNRRCVGFHPGSGITKNLIKKRWPAEKWPQLSRLIAEDERTCILLFGSPAEAELRAEIISASGLSSDRIIDVGNHDILDVAALIGRMDCFICNDALLTHVAAALKVPAVVVMGPLMPQSTCPYGGVPHRIVRTGISCSPCYGYSKHGIRCTQDVLYKCLQDIEPEDVFNAFKELENTG